LARAEAGGLATARAGATRATSEIPFGALAPLLPVVDPADTAGYSLQWAADALRAAAGDRPLVLFVDDAHHLDNQSAGLLLQLAVARTAFIVVTLRSDLRPPDPVVALWKDGIADRIDVGPLPRPETERLVIAALGGPVDGAALRDLWEASR